MTFVPLSSMSSPAAAGSGLLAPALVAALVAGVVTLSAELLRAHSSTRTRRAGDARTDVASAQDALGALRDAYRRRAMRPADAPDDFALASLEDAFRGSADRIAAEEVAAGAAAYVAVARLWAAGDEDQGAEAEEAAYRRFSAALRRYLAENR